ncbi:family S53 protease [Vararia minispora EC-137]|uniref:Family S53 protease n=1 Tax=Vararia minispora EC-137 TaxID=1314806 RepID=A0ACB8QDU4_9AGAM|nr:family S53 protease [Vararia minispora EC-137]
MVLHERRDTVPPGFVSNGPASSNYTLTLRLGLAQGDIVGLEERVILISTPSSADYGKFMSKEQVEAYVAPKQETTTAMQDFLAQNNLTAKIVTPAGDILSIDLTVEKANSLFDAQFQTFVHTATQKRVVRTLHYSIPVSLKGHLDFVHPTTVFPELLVSDTFIASFTPGLPSNTTHGTATSSSVPSSCSSVITPACLQALYGIPTTPATQTSNQIGVSGLLNQYANQADLKDFLTALRTDINPSTTFTLETINNGQNPQGPSQAGVEADLDVQMTVGIATGVPTVFISVGNGVDGFLAIPQLLLSQSNPPSVFTTSYGSNEAGYSPAVASNLCNTYMQLAARGTSALYASGDSGVGSNCNGAAFAPTYPSGCPYITSVGATTGVPETAASFSTGGFSNLFARPSYQDAAVSGYLAKLGGTNSGLYNASGRAFPDVAAMGNNVEIFYQGSAGLVAGTSCSSPIFAAIVGLLNDELVAAGKSRLGFLNPLLYSSASAFNDITTGSNPGCGTNGFPAEVGWDPVTGLGTPNYAALRAAVGL